MQTVPPKRTDPLPSSAYQRAAAGLSRWIVAALVIWLIADMALRLLPLHWLHVLPEHEATRRPGRFYPFIPNLSIRYEPWIGETATTGNLPPDETRGPIEFSTDRLGFRQTPDVPPEGKVDLLLFAGASFAYGGGLSDGETFPAEVTRQTGLRMYNGGHFFWDPMGLDALEWLTKKLGSQRPVIVLLEWEQFDHQITQLEGLPWRLDRPGQALLGVPRYRQWRDDIQYARRYANALTFVSPLEILSVRFYKKIYNDRVLPNHYREAVIERQLPGGKRILFLKDEFERATRPVNNEYVQQQADYFSYYAQRLAERHLKTCVILIPNKYTLYGPLTGGRLPEHRYLDRLEQALSDRHIPVLNGLSVLEPGVANEVRSGQMSFYRDDHHWTARGVRTIAAAFARKLKEDHALQ
jgi:SGNH hydrolase-like domain, acetyltransferase AlgX